MTILFILGILLGSFTVIFALQNNEIVTVSFFSWSTTGSLSVVLFATILSGILITLLLFVPGSIRNYWRHRKLKKENSSLKEELEKQKEKTLFAKTEKPSEGDLEKIEKGVIENSQ